jgi:tetratricopeptide (TPR) repeat protein
VVLEENGPEAAVVLWQILQDVTLWGMIAPEKRGPGLFHDEPGEVGDVLPDLRLDLEALQVLVRDSHADAAPIIASVCTRIMTWAEAQGRTGTALSFAQAAALVDRTNPRCAYQVGRQARRKADLARATAWYQRAIVLARRSGDWEVEARSYSGLGIVLWQTGNRERSVELQERVIRIARRYHLREVRADAHFDLAVLNYELGNPQAGLASAELALRLYGPGHSQIPALAQNIAVCWMDYRGAYLEALKVLREMATLLFRPTERIRLLANLARAAAGTGDQALLKRLGLKLSPASTALPVKKPVLMPFWYWPGQHSSSAISSGQTLQDSAQCPLPSKITNKACARKQEIFLLMCGEKSPLPPTSCLKRSRRKLESEHALWKGFFLPSGQLPGRVMGGLMPLPLCLPNRIARLVPTLSVCSSESLPRIPLLLCGLSERGSFQSALVSGRSEQRA